MKYILFLFTLTYGTIIINQLNNISSHNLVYSGTISIPTSQSLFFVYYGIDHIQDQKLLKNYPLTIFLGNPGSSSLYYNLAGFGPYLLQSDLTLIQNPNSLTNSSNIMFLDFLGTGFSFAKNPNSIPEDFPSFGKQITNAINTLVSESQLGKSQIITIVGQGTFIRTLPGLGDIEALKTIVHVSAWPELYAMGRYQGVAGTQLQVWRSTSQKITIQTTFITCYKRLQKEQYQMSHRCYDQVLGYIESKTNNTNLYDIRKGIQLMDDLIMVQEYFSNQQVINLYMLPQQYVFEGGVSNSYYKNYLDLARNYTHLISQYTRDYFYVNHWFLASYYDLIVFRKALLNWIENQLNFVKSQDFRNKKLQPLRIDGKLVGYEKEVLQIRYTEIMDSGHYVLHDNPTVIRHLFEEMLNKMKVESKVMIQQQ